MEIPERIQKAYDEVIQQNINIGSNWINPILELAVTPEFINKYFRVICDKSDSIYETTRVEICNVNIFNNKIVILYRVCNSAVFE